MSTANDLFFKNKGNTSTSKVCVPGLKMNRPLTSKGSKYKGDIGIELEVEGRGLLTGGMLDGISGAKSKAVWQAKNDGSLRGGYEYVLSCPCYEDEVFPLVSGFFNRSVENGTRFNNSNRCSTHVHINLKSLTVNQVCSAIVLWKIFEQSLIDWCGEARTKNHFCLSSSDEESFNNAWIAFLKTGKRPQDRHLKYSALNLLTIWSIGSLEFRCGPAPDEPTRPSNFAIFLYNLVKYGAETFPSPSSIAYELSERTGVHMFKDICDKCSFVGGVDFFNEVVGTDENTFNENAIEGFRNAQPYVLGFPWDEWLEEINKEYVPNPFDEEQGGSGPPQTEGIRIEDAIQAIRDAEEQIRRDEGWLNVNYRLHIERGLIFAGQRFHRHGRLYQFNGRNFVHLPEQPMEPEE